MWLFVTADVRKILIFEYCIYSFIVIDWTFTVYTSSNIRKRVSWLDKACFFSGSFMSMVIYPDHFIFLCSFSSFLPLFWMDFLICSSWIIGAVAITVPKMTYDSNCISITSLLSLCCLLCMIGDILYCFLAWNPGCCQETWRRIVHWRR